MGTSYRCVCPEGFRGRHCETSATSCEDAPCQHGGVCMPQAEGFLCVCQAGYTGVICEHETNECEPVNPCLNGEF